MHVAQRLEKWECLITKINIHNCSRLKELLHEWLNRVDECLDLLHSSLQELNLISILWISSVTHQKNVPKFPSLVHPCPKYIICSAIDFG